MVTISPEALLSLLVSLVACVMDSHHHLNVCSVAKDGLPLSTFMGYAWQILVVPLSGTMGALVPLWDGAASYSPLLALIPMFLIAWCVADWMTTF